MEIKPVMSRHVAGVGYDPESQTLQVAFNSGSQYVYKNVPQETYEAMLQADSVGSFHALQIRSKFPFEKVTTDAVQE